MEPLTAYGARHARHYEPILRELERRGHDICVATRVSQVHTRTVLVASGGDALRFAARRVIYVEHGAGQTYVDGPPASYAGAPRMGHVRLFLCPNERVADRWRASYPQAAVETVGCPALDQHVPRYTAENTAIVAMTFHWRCDVCPETYPALAHYEAELPRLAAQFDLLGHAHPRDIPRARERWAALGVRFEPDPDCVLRSAQLVVADNTSLLYEAAALGIPTLALNAPSYRRDVEHGLRFWSHVPGLMVDEPEFLARNIARALRDPREAQRLRRRAAKRAYAAVDGHASERAADAIEEALSCD